ncbi:Pca regulon regulatory protein (plasmid) [Roseivivax sp. THAF40]|uniref:IclR family transcriptional regulator n=1 Tax=unclassified Roseivivax TaxID=2639302 RepID=UPI0012680F30|nr:MULTISPECIES: IclR family transcriptional regulator C-terminal domain-containing protein [unclassified Roseivivax]QFS84925.1 Pca regulon regulatory protein [Roseivivax sp. THAF197b]QFT48626.1 Pca regulon regulatory protein [Roseivivax sp. THAF40]
MSTPVNLSVVKAFDVLELLGDARPDLNAEIVAQELRMSAATAHRFLSTLEAVGALTSVRRGVFAPGPRLTRLGRMADSLAPLPAGLQEAMDNLQQQLGEAVMACRFTPRGPLCVAVSRARRAISVQIELGTTLPMLSTAQGRLFLSDMSPRARKAWAASQGLGADVVDALEATLADIRRTGIAINQGDNEPDIGAISVPVRMDGHLSLTLSTFGMLSRFDAAFRDRAGPLLKDTAMRITTETAPSEAM